MSKFLLGNEYNMLSSIALFGVSFIMLCIAVLGLIWAFRSGCFKDSQKIALDILDENR